MESKLEKVYTVFQKQTEQMLELFAVGCDQAAQVLKLSSTTIEQKHIEAEIKSKRRCYLSRLEFRSGTIALIREGATNSSTVEREADKWCRTLINHTGAFKVSLEGRKHKTAKELKVRPYRIK